MRVRRALGRTGDTGERELDLRALFAALDLPWEEERSRQAWGRALERLASEEAVPQQPRPGAG